VLQGAAKDLVNLLNQGLTITYKINYETTSPEGEKGDAYVIFRRPPRARVDTIPADATQPSSILIGGDRTTTTVNCSGGPGHWRCVQIEPIGDSLLEAAGPIIFLTPVDLASFDVSQAVPRTVAGNDAPCYRLTPKTTGASGGPAEYCLRADGVPLYTNSAIGTVEATAVSATVSDADFTAPAALQPR